MHCRTRNGSQRLHEPHSSLGQFSRERTEYENEVLWFERSLGPSECPQSVARLFKALSGPGKRTVQSEREKRRLFAGKDAEQHLEFVKQLAGIFPIPDLGNELDDCFFRLKRATGETMAG